MVGVGAGAQDRAGMDAGVCKQSGVGGASR